MFRNVIFYLFMVLVTIPFCCLAVVISLFDKVGFRVQEWVARPWARSLLWVSGVRVYTTGLENISGQGQYIFATNHQSYFDILALLSHLPVPFAFIMKEELMKIPLFGQAMKRAGYIGISREDPRRAIHGMNLAAKRAKQGFSFVIFPEGTRSLDGTLNEFKRGAFSLALKTGLDIVPVAISGSFRIAKKGRLFLNRGSFGLHVMEPIGTKGVGKRQIQGLMDQVRRAIQSGL